MTESQLKPGLNIREDHLELLEMVARKAFTNTEVNCDDVRTSYRLSEQSDFTEKAAFLEVKTIEYFSIFFLYHYLDQSLSHEK